MQAESGAAGRAGRGPAACGYQDQCWTLARVADLAWQRFGVQYTLAEVHLLLHRAGWSVQVPARRAAERGEAAVAAWRDETWPVIKGRPLTWGMARLRGRVRAGLKTPEGRTWGRRGRTPVVTVTGGNNRRVSLAALIAVKAGERARLVFRVHSGRPGDKRKGSPSRAAPGCWTPRTGSSEARSW